MKIKKFLSIILPVLSILLISILCLNLKNINVSGLDYSSDNTDIVISVEKELEFSNGNAKANRSGYINLHITLNKAVKENTTLNVYYHTENISAVAYNSLKTTGDYTSLDSYVTFTGSQTTKSIAIEVSESPYSVILGEEEIGRTFKFVIDSSSSGTINEATRETICQLSSTVDLTATKEDGMKYYAFSDYLGMISSITTDSYHLNGSELWSSGSASEYANIKLKYDCDEEDNTYSNLTMFTGEQEQYYKLKYLDTNLASAYLTTTFDSAAEYFLNLKDIDFDLYTTEGTSLLSLCLDGPFVDADSGDFSQYLRPIDLITIVSNDKNPYDMDSDTYYEKNKTSNMGGIPVDVDSSRYTSDYTIMQPYGESSNYCFLKIPDGEKLGGFVTVFNETSLRTRWINGISIYSALIDTTNPIVEGYYFDDSSFNTNGKVRISIRFSEPVQIQSGVNPTIKVNFKFGTTDQLVTFKYLSGDKTDTLCFETNLDEASLIAGYYGSATVMEIVGALGIGDFAYIGTGTNVGCFNKLSDNNIYSVEKKISSIEIDYRKPYIDKDSMSTKSSSSVLSRREFKLTVGNITKGTVYYSVSENATAPLTTSEYEYSISIPENALTDKNGDYVVNFSVSGISGNRYIHVKVVSNKYENDDSKSACFTYGIYEGDTLISGYKFDNSLPVIGDISFSVNKLDTKTLNFEITKPSSTNISSIDSIYMSVISEDENGDFDESLSTSYCIWADSSSENKKISFNGSSGYIKDTETKGNFTLSIDGNSTIFGLSNLENGKSSGKYLVAFYSIDTAGNISELSDYITLRFNLNSTLVTSFNSSISPLNIKNNSVYDLTDSNLEFTFSRSTSNGDEFKIYSINRGDETIYDYTLNNNYIDGISDYFTVITSKTNDKEITLKPLISGYYEVILCSVDGDTVTESTEIHDFYVTAGTDSSSKYNDESINYNSIKEGLVLNNKVFMVSTKFSYLNNGDTLEIINANYNNSSYPQAFSSQSKAKEYVLYYEYKDLYLFKLSATQALNINANANYYEKAENETNKAVEGEWWIRYKRSSWTYSSTQSDWVMYYYSSSNPTGKIDIYKLSDNLKSAMNSVASYIVSEKTGNGYVNLVGEEYTDSITKAPKLKDGQTHINEEYYMETMLNNSFLSKIVFNGDEDICSNEVEVKDSLNNLITVPLASNLILNISSYTFLYARVDGETEYIKLKAKNGDLLKNTLENTFSNASTNSLYEILEIGAYGVKEYYVYVDNTAPKLTIDLVRYDETTNKNIVETRILSEENNSDTFSYTKFILKGFVDEIDDYAYVAEYNKQTGEYKNVYYADDLLSGIYFENGSYNIEIGDRSGNIYTITLKVNSDTLDCNCYTTDDGVYVKCNNRSIDQIYRYEVTCNDEILSNSFTESKLYNNSGNYYIYIRDIYGNVYSTSITYIRPFPSVTIYYSDKLDGDTIKYEGDVSNIRITEKIPNSGTYYITTSSYLTLKMSIDTEYSLEGLTEKTDYYVSSSIIDNTTTIRIRTLKNWVLNIGYSDGSSVNVKYICSLEITPPEITGYYKTTECIINDYNGLYKDNSKDATLIDGYKKGDIIIPDDISYTSINNNQILASNSKISSDYIKVTISDNSGIKSYSVIIDGELIENNKLEKKITSEGITLIFRKKGSYSITAIDNYNNKSTYSFVNGATDYSDYLIDGNLISDYLEIENKTYGHESGVITLNDDGTVLLKIKSNDQTYFYYLNVIMDNSGINVYQLNYVIIENEDGKLDVDVTSPSADNFIFSSNSSKINENEYYDFISNDLFKLQIKYFSDIIYFQIKNNTNELSIESRVISNNSKPYYNNTILSTEKTEIVISSNDMIVEVNNEQVILLNNAFDIDYSLNEAKIKSIEIAYSKDDTFTEYVLIDDLIKEYESILNYSIKEGFYLIKVLNIYGNTKEYKINISKSFEIIAYVEYSNIIDNYDISCSLKNNKYTSDYFLSNEINSNNKVTLYIYGLDITLTINDIVTPITKNDDGTYEYTLIKNGEYNLIITDKYGVTKILNININNEALEFNNDLFIEKNTIEDILYTKSKLSINKEKLNDIYYISYKYNTKEIAIYDNLTENSPLNNLNEIDLSEIIGELGDGEYTVYIRDKFGNLAYKTINLSLTPTLIIKRIIGTSDSEEIIDVNDAVLNGIYSNAQVGLYSTALYSTLIIDESTKSSCPQIIKLDSANGDASIERLVSYSDEYGYNYTFKIYLIRQSINVEPDSSINIEVIENINTTKDNILINYSADSECIYYLDGTYMGVYNKNTLTKDGLYKFIATDKAGNTNSYIIKKDTNCEFNFTERSDYSTKEVLNGGITTTSVYFGSVNDDSVYLYKIVLNGKEYTDYEGTVFSEDGKWEFIISDKVGNMAYYSFYIITHALSSFSYTCPYNYYIEKLYYDTSLDALTSNRKSILTEIEQKSFEVYEDGIYSCIIKSLLTGNTESFSFTIDTTPPDVELIGCNEGEVTTKDVSLKGLKNGDTIAIYKDGTLIKEYTLSYNSSVPEIDDGGSYKIIVTNEAGVSKTLTFEKKYIVNSAGSIFIISSILLGSTALFVGLLFRKRTKVDK